MNKIELIGRLTKDPELETTSGGLTYTRFTLAVNRKYENANGEREVDFINCTAWRQTAELIGKYLKKGRLLGACGTLQVRNYDAQDGTKRYVTEVIVDEITFCDSGEKKEEKGEAKQPTLTPTQDDDLPF
ncbi:MAG: single-stranded DNA-binding protein [Lachnospiraceae bacterium]|nr:single-stranded DNA-binding protein [Lachnospiraceae bacterium]